MARTDNSRDWVERYNESHQHPVNRALHAVGIPLIFVSVLLGFASIFMVALRLPALLLFVLGWVLQFIGHWVEGKPPAFFNDWRFLVTGLAWWLRKIRGNR